MKGNRWEFDENLQCRKIPLPRSADSGLERNSLGRFVQRFNRMAKPKTLDYWVFSAWVGWAFSGPESCWVNHPRSTISVLLNITFRIV